MLGLNRWKIRGTVIFKYNVRQFTGQYGAGEIFSFDIRDSTAEITVTSFNLNSKVIRDRIELGKVYSIRIVHLLNKRKIRSFSVLTTNRIDLFSPDITVISYRPIKDKKSSSIEDKC